MDIPHLTLINRRTLIQGAGALTLTAATGPVQPAAAWGSLIPFFLSRMLTPIAVSVAGSLIVDAIRNRAHGMVGAMQMRVSADVRLQYGCLSRSFSDLHLMQQHAIATSHERVGIACYADKLCDYVLLEPHEVHTFDAVSDTMWGLPGTVSGNYRDAATLCRWALPVAVERNRCGPMTFYSPAGARIVIHKRSTHYVHIEIQHRGRMLRNTSLPISPSAQAACEQPGRRQASTWETLPAA